MNKHINKSPRGIIIIVYLLLFCGAVLTAPLDGNGRERGGEDVKIEIGTSNPEQSDINTWLNQLLFHSPSSNMELLDVDTLNKNCEHNVLIIECDGCRHEVGVVKVDYEFLNKEGLLELTEAKVSTLNSIIEAPGEISTNPDREVHITPRIPGIIKEVYKGLGDKVKAGETVALLDSIEFGQAKSDYLKAKAMMELAGKNYDRVKTLSEKQVVSQKSFIEAESELGRAKIELQALEERLHLLGMKDSDVQKIKEHEEVRSLLPIIAPMDGTIIEKHAVIGERVDPSVGLFRVADLTRLWVWFDVYEKDLAKVKNGQKVSLLTLAYPDEKFEGEITYIGNMVSEKTRTTKVRAEVDNAAGKLKPGMFVTVTIHLKEKEEALTVPRDSVQSDGVDKIVFIPIKNDYFIKKKVILGAATQECYEVLNGLKDGQKVVTKGSFLLKSELQKEKFGEGCPD